MKTVVIGGTGAVGSALVGALAADPFITEVRCLVRRKIEITAQPKVSYLTVDLSDPGSYVQYLTGCDAAFITLGVGQPSQVSKDELLRIDFQVPLAFAKACRQHQVDSISVLTAVMADPKSRVDYFRIKGELESGIETLKFRGSFFYQPSMLMTKTNRYDWKQGLILKIYPALDHLLLGPLKKYRSIPVETLGRKMAEIASEFAKKKTKIPEAHRLTWPDFNG